MNFDFKRSDFYQLSLIEKYALHFIHPDLQSGFRTIKPAGVMSENEPKIWKDSIIR